MNRFSSSTARYSLAAIILHWLLAALLLFQLSLGWRLETFAPGVAQFNAFQLHKSIGISILLLSVLRLAIRLMVRRPPPLRAHPLQMRLASAVHALLYVVMIGGPITGWILVSTARVRMQTMLFGTVPWPDLPVGRAWHEPAETLHGLIGWLLAGLVVLHVAGALYHHLLREDLVARMLPRAWGGRRAATTALVLALIGAGGALAAAKFWSFGPGGGSAPIEAAAENAADNAVDNAMDNTAAPANLAEAANAALPANGAEATVNEVAATPVVEAKEAPVPWRVEAGGRLGFRADYSGSAVEGGFKRWEADIMFSPDDLAGSRISVEVDLASVDSGDGQRDSMLTSESFFDVATHPRARFRSTSIAHRGGNRYRAPGTLTLHGQSRPVTLDFTLDIDGDTARAAGTATLRRTAFGVGTGEWAATDTISDGVTVTFAFTAKRGE